MYHFIFTNKLGVEHSQYFRTRLEADRWIEANKDKYVKYRFDKALQTKIDR